MNEIVLNLHMHTRYSDGFGSHREIARAALRQGIHAVLVTDHNVRVAGVQRYYEEGGRRVLLLVGEEIHDRTRIPQKNHLLVFGSDLELAASGQDVLSLLSTIKQNGAICFLAHPIDRPAPAFHEPDISWEMWSSTEFTGLELWNGFSELKAHLPSRVHGLFYAYFPTLMARGPLVETLELWDRLLSQRPIVAVGGSDAHALQMRLGPIRRTVFPYDYHFRAVNTHVLLDRALVGDPDADASAIYASLATGRCFIGYDLPRSTSGFRFIANGAGGETPMGGQSTVHGGASLQVWAPDNCEICLLRDGKPLKNLQRGQALTHVLTESGVYRVEAYRRFWGRRRTWIISNPIYVR